ncbi:MAG: response regulator transcription factor [Acidobacteria bacterium]|nr:response regulator transcription factor [Acidobacteriota bacterium]
MSRILIVEDEPAIALALQTDLRLEGYEVEVAEDGETASQRARDEPFDLILLDIMLPGKDGFAVCREVRSAGVKVPILMLTAKAQEAEKVLGLELGADDYVTKPFSALELRARIKALLRRTEDATPEVQRFGDLEIDFGRIEVRRADVALDVTPIEFKILAALVKRGGRVVSRNRLLDLVWGENTYGSDRVIDNHVANLRKKLEDDPKKPRYVISVRGVGYRFDG